MQPDSCVLRRVGDVQLTANTPEDYDLKFKMLNDVMDIIDLEQRCVGQQPRGSVRRSQCSDRGSWCAEPLGASDALAAST